MRRATERRVRLFLRLSLIGTLIGIAYSGLIGLVFRVPVFPRSLVGAIDGAAITVPIAAMEIFLLRSRWGSPLRQAPFMVTFGVKWLVYAMIITTVIAGEPGARARTQGFANTEVTDGPPRPGEGRSKALQG
jgi:hypothetical protein